MTKLLMMSVAVTLIAPAAQAQSLGEIFAASVDRMTNAAGALREQVVEDTRRVARDRSRSDYDDDDHEDLVNWSESDRDRDRPDRDWDAGSRSHYDDDGDYDDRDDYNN